MENCGWWWGHGLMWMGWWILPVVFLVILGAFVVILFRRGSHMPPGIGHEPSRETPRQILDRRFASGEITKEQYEDMKRTLER